MRSLLVLMTLTAFALQGGCATVPKREDVLAVRKVGVSPKTFWPERGETLAIRWTQNRKAKTALEIRREDGQLVAHLEGVYPKGDHEMTWDGKDGAGQFVPTGVYLYLLRAQEGDERETVYDPSLSSGGEELKVDHFTFDRQKRQFDFILPRAGRARLRIGLSPFLHLRTLLNWEPFEAGAQTIAWDGLDASGWIRAIDHPDLSINLAAFALPDNAIILRSSQGPLILDQHGSLQKPPSRSDLYLHALHDRMQCRDIAFRIDFPELEKNQEGLPLLKEKTLVRVQLDDKDRNFMIDQRFEVMFFVDTVFLFEAEEGQDPFNFEWDTRGLAAGGHLLTVNMIGYEDHFGVKTVRVVKKGSE